MCTVLFDFAPGRAYPLILAGNRDEMHDRQAEDPAHHWPDRAEALAGAM